MKIRNVSIKKIQNELDMQGMLAGDIENQLAKSVAKCQEKLMQSLLYDGMKGIISDIGKRKPEVHRKTELATSRSRIVSYPKGYWAKIIVTDDDAVSYKLFHGGWLAKMCHKIGFRKVINNGTDSVKQRGTVEATLGATYMEIDEAISKDLQKIEHSKFLKDMIKTDPENLKAIAQLDMLDKGDGPGTNQGQGDAANGSTAGSSRVTPTYAQSMAVAGTGAYFVPKASGVAVALDSGSHSPGIVLAMNEKEDIIKMDPDGKVSFGDKMAEAIRKVAQEKGEIDVS